MKGQPTPEGWLDLAVGNPLAVGSILKDCLREFGWSSMFTDTAFSIESLREYPDSAGNPVLRDFLSDRHGGSPVVIVPGAKYGLYAMMCVAKQTGSEGVLVNRPYWVSMPRLVSDAGLDWREPGDQVEGDLEIIVSPNNPDGFIVPSNTMEHFSSGAHNPLSMKVHDAAYHSPIYMPDWAEWNAKHCDAQIFSSGKMWGLSGLRIGYVVCHERGIAPMLEREMERLTCGVSSASQQMLLDLELAMSSDGEMHGEFVKRCRSHFSEARALLSGIKPWVLGDDPKTQHGMFAWMRKGPSFDVDKIKALFIDGEHFGVPGYVRINCSAPLGRLEELVRRCNE